MKSAKFSVLPPQDRGQSLSLFVLLCCICAGWLSACDMPQPSKPTTDNAPFPPKDPCGTLRSKVDNRPHSVTSTDATASKVNASTPLFSEPEQVNHNSKDIYARFVEKKSYCPLILEAIAQDKDLKACLHRLFSEGKEVSEAIDLIRHSNISTAKPIEFLLENKDSLKLSINCHGGPMMISSKNAGCMYCRVTNKELVEMEKQGASEASWRFRKEWLEEHFKYLNFPWFELGQPVSLDTYVVLFDETKQIYSSDTSRPWVREWLQTAETRIQNAANNAETSGYAGYPADHAKRVREIIDNFLARLHRGL